METVEGVRVKSKRPSDSNFKQQRLPSWQPVLTAGTVLPTFFIIGIAFIPVGVLLLYFSNTISEHVIDYTNCNQTLNDQSTGVPCARILAQNPNTVVPCQCRISFRLPRDFEGKVYLYYGLSNFYQNHRRYVKSRDDNQLLGEFGLPSSDCAPFNEANGKPIVPCGAIANSLFNDTLRIRSESHGNVPTIHTGIAWPSDKEIKFRNPQGDLRKALEGTSRPVAWRRELWELDLNDTENNGLQNEDLIVWMRTAALPSFRKLYRRVDHSNSLFRNGLKAGMYWLDVEYNYPVTQFDGTKSFILSTTSILGGKNPFLGWAYIVVGSVCILLGVVLLVIHLRYRGKFKSQLFTLLFALIFIPSSHLLTLNCRYNEWDWNFHQNVYECQGHHVNPEDTLPFMSNFTGVHMGGGNDTEVKAIRVMHQPSITFLPTGIGKFFPNLLGLSFMNCNIKTITKDHLEEFPEMLQVSYKLNQIEVLPGDLFIYTPKLKLINLADNNIKHIALSLFKPLKNLEYIWLGKNVCIDMNAKSSELKKLKKEILKKCKMGGKTDCKKIPAAFTQKNVTNAVDTCEVVHVYRFKAKPRHELIKLQREKEEQEQKEREDYVKNVLKVCEYDDELYRFFVSALNLPGPESEPEPVNWQNFDNDAKKKKKSKKKY